MKKYIIMMVVVLSGFVILISKDSYASSELYDYTGILNVNLYDHTDENQLKEDILNYIDLIDDSLIVNSSFNLSDKLSENYNFLTSFAISFILDNEEYYNIEFGDEYVYRDLNGNEFRTDKYINIDKIYEITNQVFGVEYYYILNDYIDIDEDMVPLIVLEDRDFGIVIDDIVDIDRYDDYIDVVVRYINSELEYVYRFECLNNRLVIGDLIIRE